MSARERLTWRDWVLIGMLALCILMTIAGLLGRVDPPPLPERPWIE